jgi:eukaryotic-like serine/threonine-protein kinase
MSVLAKLKKMFASKKSDLPIADINKRFDLLNRTGQGSMSKVWRARDNKLGRTVCLKVLDKLKTAKFDARFPGLKRPSEGAVLSALRHVNVVKAYEHGLTTKGEQYIVMELIDGVGLNFLIETKKADLQKKKYDYLIQMCNAIEYLHGQRFLHRDICPRNTMIDREGTVKLIDFGLALPYTRDFCKPGNRTGTSHYLAPELIKRMVTDHRVDLFALGVTAYELIVGELPWEKGQSLNTIQSHINRAGTDPLIFKPDLSEKLARFCRKAIERDPNDRFQTAVELRDALKRAADLE